MQTLVCCRLIDPGSEWRLLSPGAGIIDVELRARYATVDNTSGDPAGDSTEFVGGLVGLNYGPGDVYVVAQQISPDIGASRTELAAGIYHNLWDDLQLYLESGSFDNPTDEGDLVEVGVLRKSG